MRIAQHLHAGRFRALVLAPDLPEADEEALLWRVAFEFFTGIRLTLNAGQISHQSDAGTAVVSGVLAEGEFAVHVLVANLEAVIFIHDATGALVKSLAVCGRPPITQI